MIPGLGKIPWRRKWQLTSVLLLGKSHGQRSLVGYSPWSYKELDKTEQLHCTFSVILPNIRYILYLYILAGEGNGTPLQYSCLENPMEGGAWWAAVHRVTESDTTERLHFHFSLSCLGEGNGNPLQCSCPENPRDGGTWWAAIYGVAQSRTRLKQLSSSSIYTH